MSSKKLILSKQINKDIVSKALDKFMRKNDASSLSVERKGQKDIKSQYSISDTSLTQQEKLQRINALQNLKNAKDEVNLEQEKLNETIHKVNKVRKVEDLKKPEEIEPSERAPVDIESSQQKKEIKSEKELSTKVLSPEESKSKNNNAPPEKKYYHSQNKVNPFKGRERYASYRRKPKQQQSISPKKNELITIDTKTINARELSILFSESKRNIIRALRSIDNTLSENDSLSQEVVELIALELGYSIQYKVSAGSKLLSDFKKQQEVDSSNLKERPPIVTIMGHIDHGKTTLLDAMHNSKIVETESSGITQHVGTYQITTKGGRKITMLDTPGHAAFTAMRMRGAMITDIVILIIAADDGVNEQTIEAIKHIKAANVPMIVAINKIDKPSANAKKVINDLLKYDLIVEELGGDIMCVEISAKEKLNLDQLEETILFQADLMELKADYNINAEGIVVEVKLDRRSGVFATLLVANGTLKTGQVILIKDVCGKIKRITDPCETQVMKSATPGTPVSVMGLNAVPEPGSKFIVVKNEKEAKKIIDLQQRKLKAEENVEVRAYFEDEGKHKLNFIIKGDVYGSVEAIAQSLTLLNSEEVEIKAVHQGVGEINESDIELANTSDAYIIGFNVKPDKKASNYTKLILHSVIYHIIDDVNKIIKKLLGPTIEEEITGVAEVKEVFTLSDSSIVAGCYVKSGVIKYGTKAKLLRSEEIISDSTSVKTLKHFKENAKEVKVGYECGIALSGCKDIKSGDIIQAFITKEI